MDIKRTLLQYTDKDNGIKIIFLKYKLGWQKWGPTESTINFRKANC